MKDNKPQLRLVKGAPSHITIGSMRLAVARPEDLLLADAVVLEEDTWLILSAATELSVAKEHPIRLFTKLIEAEALAPGTVVVRQGTPLTFLAVVHDFAADPCCRPEWIRKALDEAIRICGQRHICSLVLPLLGVCHGRMPLGEVVSLLASAAREADSECPKSLLVAAPPGYAAEVRGLLSKLV